MAAVEEPFFDPTLKKKKKKKVVAFNEDPLGADADPTTPAPPLDDSALGGPTTVHEQMKQNGGLVHSESKDKEEDELKAMFGDLKKKKKKKEIPMDLVSFSQDYVRRLKFISHSIREKEIK